MAKTSENGEIITRPATLKGLEPLRPKGLGARRDVYWECLKKPTKALQVRGDLLLAKETFWGAQLTPEEALKEAPLPPTPSYWNNKRRTWQPTTGSYWSSGHTTTSMEGAEHQYDSLCSINGASNFCIKDFCFYILEMSPLVKYILNLRTLRVAPPHFCISE